MPGTEQYPIVERKRRRNNSKFPFDALRPGKAFPVRISEYSSRGSAWVSITTAAKNNGFDISLELGFDDDGERVYWVSLKEVPAEAEEQPKDETETA